MQNRLLFVLACLSVACAPNITQAFPAGQCRLYYGHESDIPPLVKEALDQVGGAAVEQCGDAQSGAFKFLMASTPRKGSLGICYYTTRPIFRAASGSGKSNWGFSQPTHQEYSQTTEFMAEAEGICPPQGDLSYVKVFGLSEGTFASLARLWHQTTSSADAFDRATATLPPEVRDLESLAKARAELPSPTNLVSPPRLLLIALGSNDTSLPHYSLEAAHWELIADLTKDGFAIVGFGVGGD